MADLIRKLAGWFPSKANNIGIEPPEPRPGREGVAVVAIVKNEERHIADWAAHHLAAQAAHIWVYDNGSTDGTLAELRRLRTDRISIISWNNRLRDVELNRNIHVQTLAYAHAVSNFGSQYRWMAFIDADEYLIPKRATSLSAALAPLEQFSNVSLPWHMFGHCGHRTPPPGGVVQNYRFRMRDPVSGDRGIGNFKYIVDPCKVSAMRVHKCETVDMGRSSVNDRGERTIARSKPGFYSADNIQLNHYYGRSEAEFAERLRRGRVSLKQNSKTEEIFRRKMAAIERDPVEDLAAFELHRQPEFKQRLDAIRP